MFKELYDLLSLIIMLLLILFVGFLITVIDPIQQKKLEKYIDKFKDYLENTNNRGFFIIGFVIGWILSRTWDLFKL